VRFTHQEDLTIAKYSTLYGHDWAKIATYFVNRTPIMLKNRYYHMKKKGIFDSILKDVENFDTEDMNDNIPEGVQNQNQPQIFSSIEENLDVKPITYSNMNIDLSNLSTDIQCSEMATPKTESQNFDPQDLYMVQDQLPHYEDNTAQHFFINDLDSLDWLNKEDLEI